MRSKKQDKGKARKKGTLTIRDLKPRKAADVKGGVVIKYIGETEKNLTAS